MLMGSSLLPALIDINGTSVQLGDVVRHAQKASELSVGEWNNLDPLKREHFLAAIIYRMREESTK